jgi:hypothetical protein
MVEGKTIIMIEHRLRELFVSQTAWLSSISASHRVGKPADVMKWMK